MIVDIDECARNISGCNQNCTNTIGSYFCTCYPGFEMLNDNRTCVGKYYCIYLCIQCMDLWILFKNNDCRH